MAGPGMSGALDPDVAHNQVQQDGFAVVEQITQQSELDAVLARFGRTVPQYDGKLAYEVKAEPGFDDRAYSKSQNEIRAHTEAPGWQPPPSYLALWCHVQAQGSGGETCLADLVRYLTRLDPTVVEKLHSCELRWAGTNTSGTGSAGTIAPILTVDDAGHQMLRFSYNLLTKGDYDPPLDSAPTVDELPLGAFGLDLAHRVHDYFTETALKIRIPQNAVLIWDNQRMAHARTPYIDSQRHLTRFWVAAT